MAQPDWLFTSPGFLSANACSWIRRAMDAGVQEPGEVLGETFAVDTAARLATHVEVHPSVLEAIEEKLDSERERIAAFYGITLERREGANLLRYPPGGFYKPHRDRGAVPSWPDAARRRIAVIAFLNGAGGAAGAEFSGGALRLYADESPDPVEVLPQRGLLVAFPADVLHEVTAVSGGVRDTIVDWFY